VITGTVKWFDPDKGFGSVARHDDDADVFVHISAVMRSGRTDLVKGTDISFTVETDTRGRIRVAHIEPAG